MKTAGKGGWGRRHACPERHPSQAWTHCSHWRAENRTLSLSASSGTRGELNGPWGPPRHTQEPWSPSQKNGGQSVSWHTDRRKRQLWEGSAPHRPRGLGNGGGWSEERRAGSAQEGRGAGEDQTPRCCTPLPCPTVLPVLTPSPDPVLHPKAGAMSLPRADGFSSPKREKSGPQLPGPLQTLPALPNTGTATHENPVRVPPFVTKSS